MPGVEVLVPWRPGCPHRQRAWEWVRSRYAQHHPDWNVTEAEAPGGPWVKARAVMPAAEASCADVLVVADADVWTDHIAEAVDVVQRGRPWAIPHLNVHRLTQDATTRLIAGGTPARGDTTEPPYRGVDGGGIVVLHRSLMLSVPLDPRFEGWGGEDISWGIALTATVGRAWRGSTPLLHLWHPPQPRMTRKHGSIAGKRLHRRYAASRASKGRMTQLIQEVHECLSQPSSTAPAPSSAATRRGT